MKGVRIMKKTVLNKEECRKIALRCLLDDYKKHGDYADYEINLEDFKDISGNLIEDVYMKYVVKFTYLGIELIATNVVDEEDDIDSCNLDIVA